MKKTFIYSAVSQAVLLAIAAPAMAEEQVTQLDEIVVSGGSMFKMGEVPFHQAKSAVAMSREDLDKQAVSKADEIGRYQSGFSNQVFGNDTNTNWFRVRGAEVSQAVNGLPTFSYGFFTPYVETFGLEAVEVTKGADSMTFGAANSGGLINYVTKRAHQDQIGKGEFKLSGGTQNSYGFGADYTGKISDDEKVRYRIVTSYNAKDGDWDKTNNKTFYIAPTLAWDISDRTRLNILTSYQRDSGTPSSNFLPQEGTLKPSPNGYISRNVNLGDPKNDTETNRQYSLGYELEHQFNNDLSVNSSYRYSEADNYHKGAYVYPSAYNPDWSPLAPSAKGYELARGVVFNDGKLKAHATDNRLTWKAGNDFVKNTLVVGTDYRYSKVDALYTIAGATSAINLLNPTAGWGQAQNLSAAKQTHIKARQLGFYLQNSTRFADKFNLGLGIRHDRAKQDEYTSTQSVKNNHTSYSASFMYEAPFGLNPYVSYSESFNLPVGISGNQKLYDPNITKQYEVGVKYLPTWLDGSITVAGFRAKDKGALIASPNQNGLGVTVSSADTIRRKGIEVQMDTNLTPNWNLGLAYTYLKSVTKKATGDVRNPLIPTSTLAARTAYTFENGALKDLTLGAGLRYVGHSVTSTGSLYSGAKVPSATVVDLMARYQVTPNLAVQVNADNVGNRRYVAGCDYYCYYGAERKVSGSLNYKF
ncbi:TonB-dependent siderophore receptor [Haemophilus paracuniculus]|uniref:TonB-dependent siderophore receptor n=1 Tax=Haemophilus paracuniculus TaxID=734 RepID=A0A1T0AT94_9PAST|nr:TonB-dependent siderophore receptor [Haemophilus paracuniculus]OOR99781.1 TonB-dependent siderophore receptor [Haemophilus paracuniculus]